MAAVILEKIVRMKSYIDVLKSEFDGVSDSFYWHLRSYLRWNYIAFTRMVDAMAECCRDFEGNSDIPRWLTDGFYSTYRFTKSRFPFREEELGLTIEYRDKAIRRLDDLCFWLFSGKRPYMTKQDFVEQFGEDSIGMYELGDDPLSENLLDIDHGKE